MTVLGLALRWLVPAARDLDPPKVYRQGKLVEGSVILESSSGKPYLERIDIRLRLTALCSTS